MRSILDCDSGGGQLSMRSGLSLIQESSGVGFGLEIKIQESSEEGRT